MLRKFYMVFKWFSGVFASVSDGCFKCLIFIRILQVLYLNVFLERTVKASPHILLDGGKAKKPVQNTTYNPNAPSGNHHTPPTKNR
jgi:hypothetical protein